MTVLYLAILITIIFPSLMGLPVSSNIFNASITAKCPSNTTSYEDARLRKNCTGNTRYMCAPYKDLSYLLEYCTSTSRSRFVEGNCLALQDSGYLDKIECRNKFVHGCPNTSILDENLYKYPACLTINAVSHCFVAEKNCTEGLLTTTENVTMENVTDITAKKAYEDEEYGIFMIFIITMLLPPCIAVIGLIFLYTRRKKKKSGGGKTKVLEDLNKKNLEVHHCRCIILGCGGAGKSTLLARLQDKPYKEIKKIERTQGIDVHVNIFEVLEESIQRVPYKKKETPGMSNIVFSANDDIEHVEDKSCYTLPTEVTTGNEIEDSEENTFLLTESAKQSEDKGSFKSEKDDNAAQNVIHQDQENTAVHIHVHSSKETVGEQVKKHENVDTKEDNKKYVIKEILDTVTQLVNENPRKPRITFLDFAGQDDYYAFHQIYLSPKTFYILVVDMSKSFDEENELDGKSGNRFTSWKYKDYYKFWLKSIDSFSDIHTPVIVVGTHADGKPPQECNKFFKEFFKLFDGREDLQRHLHTDRRFSIKFPAKGSELENLSEIKKCISNLVQGFRYWGEPIRLSWTIFEQILEREKTLKQRKIITRAELLDYNQVLEEEFRMKDEDITTMLLFLHRVGALLFIDEENLRNTIILDVQWFVEAFKSIITYSVSIAETSNKQNIRFHDTGELQDTELDDIWRADSGHDFIDNKKNLIDFMEQLGLLAVCSSEGSSATANGAWYYFPCMNRRKFDRKGIQKHKSSSILCFQFDEEGQLPIFLFYHLVLKCFKLPKWSILREGGQRCIYDRVACFCFQKHIVVICICKLQIQAQVFVPNGFIQSTILAKVQTSLKDKIQEVLERRKEVLEHTYWVGYKCQNGVLNDEEDDSFIDQRSFPVDDYFLCEKCNVGEKHYVENRICWILKSKEEAEILDTPRPFVASKEVTDEGSTSLGDMLEACLVGNIDSFKFHLENTFESRKRLLQKVDRDGWNALHYAAKGGNREIFETLLRKDLDIFQKTNDGMTMLHVAAQNTRLEICQCVLENSECKQIFNETSSQGKNACHYAAEAGCIDVLKLLAANDIDVTATTNDGQNIFHIACIYGKLDMCKYIADNYDRLIRRECNDKWDATLYAAKEGNNEMLSFLNEKKFRFVHKSESGRNALHIACDNGHLGSCKFLIEVCPALLNEVDHKGRHAGHFAARNGNVEIMKHLVSKNATVKQNTESGMNILHMACLHEHIDMCRYLLENFPDLNSKKTERGWTTIHFLAGKGKNKGHEIELFDMITKEKVEISALTRKGNSVLTLAITYNLYDFCDFLFRNHSYLLKVPDAIHPMGMDIKDAKMSSIVQKYIQEPTTMD